MSTWASSAYKHALKNTNLPDAFKRNGFLLKLDGTEDELYSPLGDHETQVIGPDLQCFVVWLS